MAEVNAAPRLDERTFVRLIQTHQPGVWRYLRFLGCDEAQADDLTQEAFLRVWRGRYEDRGPKRAAAYMRRVARNALIDAARQAKIRPTFRDIDAVEPAWMESLGSDEGDGFREALRHCLERLAERARLVLALFYRDEQSRTEIARTLEMTPDGVKTLMRRARETLRDCIERTVSP
jgi:RNA polymerase sigma-70 factor (ECF subfamily)